MVDAMYLYILDYEGCIPDKYRMLNGTTESGKKDSLIAYCCNSSHPGFMRNSDICRHKCFGKRCSCLRKISMHPYWKKQQCEFMRQMRWMSSGKGQQYLADVRQRWRDEASEKAGALLNYCRMWTEIANLDGNFLVVDVKAFEGSSKNFRVFYVSDRACYDAVELLGLVKDIQKEFDVRVKLVHVKGLSGEYVTVEDYKRRKK